MTMLAKRLRKVRTDRGLSQGQLANRLGNSPHLISQVEQGRCGLTNPRLSMAAQTLGVSIDYLIGLTDEQTPSHQLARELNAATARVRDLEDQQAQAGITDDGDFIGVSPITPAGGDGAVVDDERITGALKFRRDWLRKHGLDPRQCRVLHVMGESMEPTLVDGASILVNLARQRRRDGRIYVVRTEDGLIVKRAGKDRTGNWQLVSDNPDQQTWPPRPWPPDAPMIGEVKWTGRTFV